MYNNEKPSIKDLMHYGTKFHSGRYPYGSGEDPYQHSGDFLSRIRTLRKENFTYTDKDGKTWTGDTAIAKSMGLSTTQFRTQQMLANHEEKAREVEAMKAMRKDGYSLNAIAAKFGYNNDSSVRSKLNEDAEARRNLAKNTAEHLKSLCDSKGMIDVGKGVEKELGVSPEKMKEALYILEVEGYNIYGGGVAQVTNAGKQTVLKVLCPPGTEHKEIYNYDKINSVGDYQSFDGGDTFKKSFAYPSSMDSKRLTINYAEDGGVEKDGLIELRRGVDDLSLGNSHYAQVRIMVDNSKYIKGMAVYADDLPDGIDVRFNTNKSKDVDKMSVLKNIKDDPDNPFGSLIKEKGGQSYYIDKDGNEKLSLINKRADEGDWGSWGDRLPSQFLSKQSMQLINKQIDLSIADKMSEYEEICALTNPTVKKAMLKSFADDCDSTAVHLEAAALPRQKYQVILPVPSLKDNEVYAPGYKPGEEVALIRYPHGGTFEIPILKVNNKNKEAQSMIGNGLDVVGINKNIADRLSGADFDGDTVMVIPTGPKVKITSTQKLKDLEGFDTKLNYGPDSPPSKDKNGNEVYRRGNKTYPLMKNTQTEMGVISNLITDMTLKGATTDELARAVKHSMVVIDAEKHHLDYKQSERDNGISALKKKYQGTYGEDGKYHEGASTLISRAKSQASVLKRRGSVKYNTPGKKWYDPSRPEGSEIWTSVVEEYYTVKVKDPVTGKKVKANKEQMKAFKKAMDNGDSLDGYDYKVKKRTQKSTKMAETDDAFTLVSDYRAPAELAYANYANKMKGLANSARKEVMSTGKIQYDKNAKETYRIEVASLKAQLNESEKNAPRERKAQLLANADVERKKKDNPGMTTSEIKKASQQALTKYRIEVGAERKPIKLTDKTWEAIQSGAVSENLLSRMMNYIDKDSLRERATPRNSKAKLSPAKISKIQSMYNSGYNPEYIAQALNIAASTVSKYVKGDD